MNITTFYNHSSLISDAKKGASIISGEKRGTETTSFQVGDKVCSTELSRYTFKKGVIIEQYNQNGYFYHVVMIGKKTVITVRTKDIKKTMMIQTWFVVRKVCAWEYVENLGCFSWVTKSHEYITPNRDTKEEATEDYKNLGFELKDTSCPVQCNDKMVPGKSWVRHIVQCKTVFA